MNREREIKKTIFLVEEFWLQNPNLSFVEMVLKIQDKAKELHNQDFESTPDNVANEILIELIKETK